jgi:hypothetical protein
MSAEVASVAGPCGALGHATAMPLAGQAGPRRASQYRRRVPPGRNIFAGHSRKLFLSGLGADDACLRGRDWTLHQAITGLYYWGTNPGMIRQASYALAQVLADTLCQPAHAALDSGQKKPP